MTIVDALNLAVEQNCHIKVTYDNGTYDLTFEDVVLLDGRIGHICLPNFKFEDCSKALEYFFNSYKGNLIFDYERDGNVLYEIILPDDNEGDD